MDVTSIFFILFSLIVIVYLLLVYKSQERIHFIVELFFISIYGFVFLIFLFPNTLKIIENILGIQSALNFIIYLSIFVAYLFLFTLYSKSEKQREEITKLTRELALFKKDEKK